VNAPTLLGYVEEYIALRQSLGFAVVGPAALLREFAHFAAAGGHHGPLTIDLALRWAEASESRDPVAPARRLSALRGFARCRVAFDPATEVPPRGLLGRPATRKTPHLYTGAEIEALLGAAAEVLPRRGLRPFTYVTFFAQGTHA